MTPKKISILVFRIAIAALILWALTKAIDVSATIDVFRSVKISWIAAALLLIISLRFIAALRWQCILVNHGRTIPFKDIVRITFISSSLGQILPAGIGADVVRGIQLSQQHGNATNTTASILIDRFVGIYSMFLVALIGAIIAYIYFDNALVLMPLVTINTVIIVSWVLSDRIYHRLATVNLSSNRKLQSVYKKLLALLAALTDKEALLQIMPKIMALSIITQVLRCLFFFLLYLAFGELVPFIYCLAFIPIVFIITLIPISIGGLGVREGALIYFFGIVGIAPEISVSVGLLSQCVQILAVLPGFVLWFMDNSVKNSNR